MRRWRIFLHAPAVVSDPSAAKERRRPPTCCAALRFVPTSYRLLEGVRIGNRRLPSPPDRPLSRLPQRCGEAAALSSSATESSTLFRMRGGMRSSAWSAPRRSRPARRARPGAAKGSRTAGAERLRGPSAGLWLERSAAVRAAQQSPSRLPGVCSTSKPCSRNRSAPNSRSSGRSAAGRGRKANVPPGAGRERRSGAQDQESAREAEDGFLARGERRTARAAAFGRIDGAPSDLLRPAEPMRHGIRDAAQDAVFLLQRMGCQRRLAERSFCDGEFARSADALRRRSSDC